ncbi:MAG: stage II sporulation protein E [Bacilli bacterium]
MTTTVNKNFYGKQIMGGFFDEEALGAVVQGVRSQISSNHLFYFCIALLLGRAEVIGELLPFALPFFVTVFFWKREMSFITFVACLAGSWSVHIMQFLELGTAVLFFLLLRKLFLTQDRRHEAYAPLLVSISSLLSSVVIGFISTGTIQPLLLGLYVIEAGVAYFLVVIFMQSIHLLSENRKGEVLRIEELVCATLLIGATILGLKNIVVLDVSLLDVAARYLTIILAFSGGPTIAAVFGVILGSVISLGDLSLFGQIGMLGFCGVLAGMMKKGGKLWTSFGLLVGTIFFGMYANNGAELFDSTLATCIAILLFTFTPHRLESKFISVQSVSDEEILQNEQYVRKLRDITAERVGKFSSLFKEVANSFNKYGLLPEVKTVEEDHEDYIEQAHALVCMNCERRKHCWAEERADYTREIFSQTRIEVMHNRLRENSSIRRKLRGFCMKMDPVVQNIREFNIRRNAEKLYLRHLTENRRLVIQQLHGLSKVIDEFVEEMSVEYVAYEREERQIIEAISSLGIALESVHITSFTKGALDIEIQMPHCQNEQIAELIIAPALSGLVGETLVVKKEECGHTHYDYCKVKFRSTEAFKVDYGLSSMARGGGFVSGDNYSVADLTNTQKVFALSDGMGNGQRAWDESQETLKLLNTMLQTGMGEEAAILTVNSMLNLRTEEEMFATVDLAMIDLNIGSANFIKVGACPTFLKRGNYVKKIESNSMPIGIVEDLHVEVISETLQTGDYLIFMTDGIYEGVCESHLADEWLMKLIRGLKTESPQRMSDKILDVVLAKQQGNPRDDMTLIVVQFQENVPVWKPIPIYELEQLRYG